MAYNFQDVIRDVHDPSTHSLKTTGSAAATIFAVVNTGTAGDSVYNIGFATVSVSNPTLYAVVNTGAAGDPKTYIGLVTATLDNSRGVGVVGNVTLSDPKGYIGLVTVGGGTIGTTFAGNVTLDAGSKTQIVGNVTISDSKGFIGLVTAVSNAVDFVSTNNSSTTPLASDGNFTGTGDDCLSYQSVTVTVTSDKNSTANGMKFQFSTDNTNWDDDVAGGFDFIASTTRRFQLPVSARYFRVNYTNTNSAQTYFRLQTILHRTAVETTVHRMDADVKIDRSATLVKAGLIAQVNGSGDFTPIQANSAGILKVGGSVDVNAGANYIGLTTTTLGVGTRFIGLVTVDIGASKTIGVAGNVTLSDAKTYVGLTTTTLGIGTQFIGLVTVAPHALVGNLTLSDAKTYVGLTTTTLGVGTQFIGLVTVAPHSLVGNLTLSDSKTYIGLNTVTNGVGDRYMGLVTAWALNAGSAKTLTPFALTLSTGSVATIAVPANNARMYITNMVLSSDATVRVSIKSGVTYMTGNASLGITLNPGGGFIQTGSPDSPSWIGLPSGALVVEKFDMTGTKANIGGTVITFTE